MKKMIKMLTVLLALTLLLAACGKTPTTDLGGSGTLTLMVNPEIRIHYDGDGNVTDADVVYLLRHVLFPHRYTLH